MLTVTTTPELSLLQMKITFKLNRLQLSILNINQTDQYSTLLLKISPEENFGADNIRQNTEDQIR